MYFLEHSSVGVEPLIPCPLLYPKILYSKQMAFIRCVDHVVIVDLIRSEIDSSYFRDTHPVCWRCWANLSDERIFSSAWSQSN